VLSADLATDPVLSVLAKFEQLQYIHVYRPAGEAHVGDGNMAARSSTNSTAAGGTLLYELPRYGLTFQLQQGKLWSLDHADWYLAPSQQLVNFPEGGMSSRASSADGGGAAGAASAASAAEAGAASYTLLGFSQYLVLHRDEPGSSVTSSSVLMPAGLVTRVSPGDSGPVADSVQLRITAKCNANVQVSGSIAVQRVVLGRCL
jgi:hypothetical protein